MNGCTINIADFRCRALKSRAARPSFRDTHKHAGIALVEPSSSLELQLQQALMQENPEVYDIGIAREAQRTRARIVFRPAPVQRRAKVLRFNGNEPIRMTLRTDQPREAYRGGTIDGPYDLPPAA